MIVGVNTDVRYRGKTFHIQTEDSGPNNPVLVTHVFVGGSIIITERSEYSDLLNTKDWESAVRSRMRGQHLAVTEALQQGDFVDEIKRAGRGSVRPDIPLARDSKRTKKAKKKRTSKPPAPPPPPASSKDLGGLPLPSSDAAPPFLDLPPPTDAPPPPGLEPEKDSKPDYRTPVTDGDAVDGDRLAWYLDDL